MSTFRHNLTLLELVICLAILAALSTILLDNFAFVKLQESSNISTERGNMVKNSMNGTNNDYGYSRFASDMGRWPMVYTTDGENRYLAQLYDPSILYHEDDDKTMFKHTEYLTIDNDLLGFTNSPSFTQYTLPTVTMQVGWDGPYINVSKNINGDFLDGFGHPWLIVTDYYFKTESNTKVADYDIKESVSDDDVEIDGILSYGADNVEGGEGADEDQMFIFSENLNQARLIITLKVKDDFNPAIWNEPSMTTPETYVTGLSYNKGDVVKYGDYIYTCTDDSVESYPVSGSDPIATNTGWKWGSTCNYYDTAKVLLFTPAKGGTTTESIMILGWFEFSPQDSIDDLYSQCSIGGGKFDLDEYTTPSTSTDDEKDMLRMYPQYDWNYEDGFSTPSATFMISGLVAGKRQIYSYIAMEDGTYEDTTANTYTLSSFAASPLEYIDLKAGDNYITLYLERKQ